MKAISLMAEGTSLQSRAGATKLLITTDQEPGLLAAPVQGELDYQRCIDDKHVVSALRASDGRRLLHRASARP